MHEREDWTMRRRAFAAAAVVGWSKAAVVAPVALPMAFEQPAAASTQPSVSPAATTCVSAPNMYGPIQNTPSEVQVQAGFDKSNFGPCPGTLSLRASVDHTQWKTVGSAHLDNGSATVNANCLPGTWWYKGLYVSDDGTVVRETDTSSPTQFTC